MSGTWNIWLCPRCGVELRPSNVIPHPDWRECPKCARLIGLPDLSDEYDLGVVLEPWKDYSPDPNLRSGMIRSALEQSSGGGARSKRRRSNKKPVKKRYDFPLPLPPMGARIVPNHVHR